MLISKKYAIIILFIMLAGFYTGLFFGSIIASHIKGATQRSIIRTVDELGVRIKERPPEIWEEAAQ